MAWKDILVHLDDSPRSDIRMNIAAELAAHDDAYLAGVYGMELPSLAMFMGDTSIFDMRVADEIIRQGREHAQKAADAVRERFQDAVRQYRIPGAWRAVENPVSDAVAVHARYTDLVVVGQHDPEHPSPAGEAHLPETVILESGRPVLVIPYFGDIKPIGQTVLIGWKSGREAARAVNDALPFLRQARSVTVLAIDPQNGIGEDDKTPATDVVKHLARHGITATATHTISGGIGEGNVLLNTASDLGADLLVAGGYGHSRAREFVLGGATRSLLATMTLPVLFSH